MLDYCLKSIENVIPPAVSFRSGGILPSEMHAFVGICKAQSVTRVVESGRHLGYSTEYLAESGFEVFSIERVPVTSADQVLGMRSNVTLLNGDSIRALPTLIGDRCAVVLDGPKGLPALDLWKQVADRCVLGAIHDASKMNSEGINPCRSTFEAAGAWFTDDPEYVSATKSLDDEAWHADYTSREEMTAQGFTLAIFKGGQWI